MPALQCGRAAAGGCDAPLPRAILDSQKCLCFLMGSSGAEELHRHPRVTGVVRTGRPGRAWGWLCSWFRVEAVIFLSIQRVYTGLSMNLGRGASFLTQ